MNFPDSRIGFTVAIFATISIVIFGASDVKSNPNQFSYTNMSIQQQRQKELFQRGAIASHSWRQYGKVRREIVYPTAIQHVVVIDMENRTVDNLLSGYYNQTYRDGPNTWHDVMNIADPMDNTYPLKSNDLGEPFDPKHHHMHFINEVSGGPGGGICFKHPCESFSCPNADCHYFPDGNVTGYSYVPISDTPEYAWFIQNYASADDMLQANQGPSMPSHQYLIAGESGGIRFSHTAPYALADNPGSKPLPEPIGDDNGLIYTEQGNNDAYCGGSGQTAPSLDMRKYTFESVDNNPIQNPCETYVHGTILDSIDLAFGLPEDYDWQYVGFQEGGYWSAPTSVMNLYQDYISPGTNKSFAVDPNAYTFVQNIQSQHPTRPFAALTYLTPCNNESDHADVSGTDVYGPAWVGTVVNAIGNSQYWNSTAIIVTWDDWGGWYDHMGWVESSHNEYRDLFGTLPNPHDPNEWGLRVPLIVISPWVNGPLHGGPGYVSHGPGGSLANPIPRSQGAILNLIESVFNLSPLYTDDYANRDGNNNVDNMMDMFYFKQTALPFVAAPVPSNYQIPATCATPSPPPPP